MAVGLDAVIRTRGVGAKLQLARRLAIPSRSWMNAHIPISRHGVVGLTVAYAWRTLHLLSWSGPALIAWLRTNRSSQRA